jgi:hypothetical protein
MLSLNKNKIYYACVDPNNLAWLKDIVDRKNEHGLPATPIPPEQISIAGGFFIAHHSKIEGWRTQFDTKLRLYFKHDYLVKDDQMIIVDCILTEPQRFKLITEPANSTTNAWFQFRRFLG